MTTEARLTTIKQRDRAQRLVRRATAIAILGAAVGGGALTIELAAPSAQAPTATGTTTQTSTQTSTSTNNATSTAPTTTTAQGAATSSGGS